MQKLFNWLAKIELNHIYQKIFSFAWVWTKNLRSAKLLHWLLGNYTPLNSTHSVSQMPKTKLWMKIKFWISFSVLLSHYLSIEYKLMANSFCWEWNQKPFKTNTPSKIIIEFWTYMQVPVKLFVKTHRQQKHLYLMLTHYWKKIISHILASRYLIFASYNCRN